MQHQVGDKLEQYEVGEISSKQKTVVSHPLLTVCQVEVSIVPSKLHNPVHCECDCEDVKDDQVDRHYSVALLDLLVLFQQIADGQQGSNDKPCVCDAKKFKQRTIPIPKKLQSVS